MKRIVILGGSGFIGRAVARRLAARGDNIIVPSRRPAQAMELAVLPSVRVVPANIHNDAELSELLIGADIVINLVGILQGEAGSGFERAHVDLPRRVARSVRAAGVPVLMHMSALNADPGGPSDYLRSRGKGEAAVLAELEGSPVRLVRLRPSVVFGAEDNFINMLASLVARFPVVPLGSPGARFQPVHVEDVARAVVTAIDHPTLSGAFPLVGPQVYTLKELVEFVARTLGKTRLVVPLPDFIAMLQALVFEFPPGKWLGAVLGIHLTRDNVRSMSLPNVSDEVLPADFDWKPARLEDVSPAWLTHRNHRFRLNRFRARAQG
jgi:uncharacterized protein YbjT (DUF2867 family)